MLTARKPFTYATRRLQAGDEFQPRNRSDARVLIALGRATRGDGEDEPKRKKKHRHHKAAAPTPTPAPAPAPTPTPTPSPAPTPTPTPPAPAGADELRDLRAAYEKQHGKKPFNGWDAKTLREKLAA